jgi:hypothetical protein
MIPSVVTLFLRSTQNQRSNCTPFHATVRLYCILQLDVFDCCPFTCTFIGTVDAGIQGFVPSVVKFCSVRPGTSAAIVPQFLPLCVVTTFFSLMSSTAVLLPVRPVARSMLETDVPCHLSRHCIFVRPGTSAAIASQLIKYSAPHFFLKVLVTAQVSLASSYNVQQRRLNGVVPAFGSVSVMGSAFASSLSAVGGRRLTAVSCV